MAQLLDFALKFYALLAARRKLWQ